MENQNHDKNKDSWLDPWDTDFFETGSTRPPKKHRGLFALVLVGGIILGSILTAFGGINLQRLKQWNSANKENTLPLSLHAGSTDQTTAPSVDPTDSTEFSSHTGEASVQLRPAPEGVETVSQEGGLSLQAI